MSDKVELIQPERQKILKLETALDHLTGEELGHALDALNDSAKVLDAIFLTGIGKKNRPSGLLQVLCHVADEAEICSLIFRHTHTLGIRRQEIERLILPRNAASQVVDGKTVPAKAYAIEGKAYCRPEADALKKLASEEKLGTPAFRFQPLSQ